MIFHEIRHDIEEAVQTALQKLIARKFGFYENFNQIELREIVNIYNELHEIVSYEQIIETVQAFFIRRDKDDV